MPLTGQPLGQQNYVLDFRLARGNRGKGAKMQAIGSGRRAYIGALYVRESGSQIGDIELIADENVGARGSKSLGPVICSAQ